METPDLKAGIPQPSALPARTRGAAGLCQGFMESKGWLGLFDIAEGKPYHALVSTKSKLTGKVVTVEVVVSPSVDERLSALKLISSYGYGRPAELAAADDSGRTVTDLLLAALKAPGHNGEGAR